MLFLEGLSYTGVNSSGLWPLFFDVLGLGSGGSTKVCDSFTVSGGSLSQSFGGSGGSLSNVVGSTTGGFTSCSMNAVMSGGSGS